MSEITLAEAVDRYGITNRQLVHWIERDYLRVERKGHGKARYIGEDEQKVLAAMTALLSIGFRWEAAAPLARTAVELDGATLRLPGGVTINIPIEETAA